MYYKLQGRIIYRGQIYLMFHQWNEEPTTTTTPPIMQPQIRKFFTNAQAASYHMMGRASM
jgi:hypothetical protein